MKAKNARSEATRAALMEAALQVITESGVKSVTHRKVCSAANLALGTVNYHYADLDELLLDAFAYYVDRISEKYESGFTFVRNDEDLADAVVDMTRKLSEDTQSVVLMWEMYAQGVREKAYRQLIRKWSKRAKSGVETYCSAQVATILEAVWDGSAVQRNVGDASLSDAELREVVLAIIRTDESREYPQVKTRSTGVKA
ncbi:TetR family transcriptional regulator [Gordonia amicalis]|uniref:TetR/AcrR family transcriptional regulator n=1 Tax=Gordonia amicalis TaxID=89053 RepID=UPI0022A6BF92|nr:TetR family transcriptional regulator [Gordonia amicalis]MCZ0915051.1 TetR family transcriptional regulator [Gordonia amicalis]MCZ4652553.1 TetR family transcriptional regulator [Gordonia amicalis]